MMIETIDTLIRSLTSWAHTMPMLVMLPFVLLLLLLPVPLTLVIGSVAAIGGVSGLFLAVLAVPIAAALLHWLGRMLAPRIPFLHKYLTGSWPELALPILALVVPFWPFFLASGVMKRGLREVLLVSALVSIPASLAMGVGLATTSVLQLHPMMTPIVGVGLLVTARLGWRVFRGRQVVS